METLNYKIQQSIDRLHLNLEGKTVLTEAATGPYAVTPLIAALAGAKVYAFTKPTRYGSVQEVREQTLNLSRKFSIDQNQLTIVDELTPDIISKADIITNSGHLRPLDKAILKHAKQGVVIPLMYEAWEWREADLDLTFCKEKNIRVGATNERHPCVDVFNYLGDMALKMIFDAGFCPYKNNFVLICNNSFGSHIANVLSKVCEGLAVCDTSENKKNYADMRIDWIGDFPHFNIPEKYKNADAIIFTAYPFVDTWIGGSNEPITLQKLRSEMNNPFILRYAGHIDEEACANSIGFYPEKVKPGHMGILPSAIGFDPIIRLQSGGLKVGELLLDHKTTFQGVELNDVIN